MKKHENLQSDKRNSSIVLMSIVEAATNIDNFAIVTGIRKEVAGDGKPFRGLLGNINGSLLIQDYKEMSSSC